MGIKICFVLVLIVGFVLQANCHSAVISPFAGKVIWAVNAGGPDHIDFHGIHYQADWLNVGIASAYGQHRFLAIGRAPPDDAILYQTERYAMHTFGYDIPIKDDGDYVLVLKFCEVYFMYPGMKVFDITLNRQRIVEQLDIFLEAGHGNAHDEFITFTVYGGVKKMRINGVKSYISRNTIRVEFLKGNLDNPKINAMYLFKGAVEEVPKLPPLPEGGHDNVPFNRAHLEDEELDIDESFLDEEYDESSDNFERDDLDEDIPIKKAIRRHSSRGPRYYKDPYEDDDLSKYLMPVIVAAGVCMVAFIAFKSITKSM